MKVLRRSDVKKKGLKEVKKREIDRLHRRLKRGWAQKNRKILRVAFFYVINIYFLCTA